MRSKEQREKGWKEHTEKYEALAQKIGIDEILRRIPFTAKQVMEALAAGDQPLNTLPLAKWSSAAFGYEGPPGWRAKGARSLSQCVCVLKHVARNHLVAS